jgi:phosphopantothenoylcysteine decarboxylase/phosphopantothenate--cysteine ligase
LKTLELDKNPDILLSLAKAKKDSQVIIGFAAETYKDVKDLELSGFTKLASKSLDLIYVNIVSGGAIFGSDKTQGLIIDKEKNVIEVPEISKDTLSDILLDQLVSKLG